MTHLNCHQKRFRDALAKQHHLTKKQGQEMLDDLISLITKHLKKGERVKIAGSEFWWCVIALPASADP